LERSREDRHVDEFVARLNIEHLRKALAGETRPAKLETLRQLLKEEEVVEEGDGAA
jgi:hypothetical protein